MKGTTNVVMRIVGALCLLTTSAAVYAQPADARTGEEFSKQERIYRSSGEQTLQGYTIDRGLSVYEQGLSSTFRNSLDELGPRNRWLDIGAGEGQAVLDYYKAERPAQKAQAVAMSIEDRRTPFWVETAARLAPGQIRYVVDKRLREYSIEELGRFELITDVIGGFSYTENLSLFMEKVLGFLQLDGSFYTVLQDVHFEDDSNRPFYEGSPFLTQLTQQDGSELKVCAWLKRIACAQVTCEPKRWRPPVEAYHVRKVCNEVAVPALRLLRYQAGTPPERQFQLTR